jgi:hypothetical protein
MSNVKSTAVKKVNVEAITNGEKTPVTSEKRYQMIAEAAYFRAEKRGFVGGDVAQDWQEAEAEIDLIFHQQLEPGKESMITKQAFQQKLEMQLKEWDAKFDKLKAMAKKAKAEIRADIKEQIVALTSKRAAAHAKILELGQHTEDTWEELRTGAEKMWGEMHEGLDRFVSHFK